MHFVRPFLLLAILFCVLTGSAGAQNKKPNPDDGYIPVVAPENKKKKKSDEMTQALALPPELPAAVIAETDRLAFQVTPLSAKGLLSQQTREALKTLLHSNRGPIVKLRAFVAGSGDLRRIGEIAGEMFLEKHMPLARADRGASGSVAAGRSAGGDGSHRGGSQSGESLGRCVSCRPARAQRGRVACQTEEHTRQLPASIPPDALLVTCFVSSLDDQRDTQPAMAASFPGVALDYVQMQRAPVLPAASCEATARLTKPAVIEQLSNGASFRARKS